MVRMTFVGARRVGLFVWLTLLVAGCASILGNDYEVEEDAAVGTGASGSRSATSTGGAGGTGGSPAASGAAGSVAGAASGAGGSDATAGASGAGGAITGGASGATGTGGSAGLDPDAGDSNVVPLDSSVADAGNTDAPSDRSQGGDAADVASLDASDARGAVDAPVCNPLNGSCGGGGLTCNAGFASCNGNVADGCECATSGCCGASCQIQHVACMLNGSPATPCIDGTGLYFYDCVSQGTFNSVQATSACAAVTGASSCAAGTCGMPPTHQVICSFDGGGNCICWEYSGTNAGRVFKSNNANCFCPGAAAPTWN